MNSSLRQTLFVDAPGSTLSLEKDHVLCSENNDTPVKLPLTYLRGIVVHTRCSISTPLIHKCLAEQIPITFLDGTGRLVGRFEPAMTSRLAIRAAQYHVAENPDATIALARSIVADKIRAQQLLLRAYRANYPAVEMKKTLVALGTALADLPRVRSLASLRGVEGAAAAAYWRALPYMLRDGNSFLKRERRPPTDPVNACLSFGYAILAHTMAAVVENAGLDSHLAVIHANTLREAPLAWDLIEPFRATCVDRVILAGFNTRRYQPADFGPSGEYPCCLQPPVKRLFIQDFYNNLNKQSPGHRFLRSALVNYVDAFISQLLALAPPTAADDTAVTPCGEEHLP